MSNIARAREILERVRGLGVVDFCVCGGSRNAPLIAALPIALAAMPLGLSSLAWVMASCTT